MKLKIDKIITRSKNKDGEDYISKFGKPYVNVSINSDGVWYSCFDYNGQTRNWAEGQEIDVEIEEKGQYKNIILPKKENVFMDRLGALEQRVSDLEHVIGNKGTLEFKKKDKDFKAVSALSQAESGGDVDTELPF